MTSAAVWLLLTRHTTRKDQGKDDFLTVHVFKQRGGYRVYHLETSWLQGVYTNRPHTLVKFDLPSGTHKLTLALAQFKAVAHQVDYTLDVYGQAPFAMRLLPRTMRHVTSVAGSWRGGNAGGCANYDSYGQNPCCSLALSQPTDVLIELQAARDDIPLGIDVAVSSTPDGGARLKAPLRSGAYRQGHAMVEVAALPAGSYKLTPSTFEPGQESNFTLSVGSSAPVKLTALPT